MSLARRFFDGFLGKRDKGEEQSKGVEPPKAGKAVPPAPKVVRPEPPPSPTPRPDRRNESQTFQVSAPKPSAGVPPVMEAAARPEPEPQGQGHRRLMPVRSSEPVTPVGEAAAADPMRRSQTIRVSPPELATAAGTVDPDITVRPDTMRRSQTVRVSAPPRPKVAVTEAPGLKRVRLRSEAEPDASLAGVELPVRALLMALPPGQRGPAWTSGSMPDGSLMMSAEQLQAQLAAGHVFMAAEEARRYLPEGWLAADVLGDVELDLAEVMAATPLELIPMQSRQPSSTPLVVAKAAQVRTAAADDEEQIRPAEAALPADVAPGAVEAATEPEAAPPAALVPSAVILAALPVTLRGPAWRDDGMPDGTVPLARDLLLEQLRAGRVTLDLTVIAASLPQGWVAPGAHGNVDLDLPALVGALPPEWLQAADEEDQEVAAAQAMGNLFAPAAAAVPAPQSPAPSLPETAIPPAFVAPPAAPPPTESDRVLLPAGLVLQALPQEMRGPEWQLIAPAGATVSVPREQLLRQLALGRVELTLDQARAQLPDGMCSELAQGTFVLDLAALVATLPTELIQTRGELDQDAVAVAAMGDLFAAASTGPETPVPAPAAPAPPPAPPPVETIRVPCAAILSVLPAALRGPDWRTEGFPELAVELPKADVLAQLASGSVTAPLSLLHGRIPAGWLAAAASGSVALNLADVVAAVPPEMMAVQEEMDDDVVAATRLGRLFAPATPQPVPEEPPPAAAAPPAAPAPEPAPATALAEGTPSVPEAAIPAAAAPVAPASPATVAPTAGGTEEQQTASPAQPALLELDESDESQTESLPEWSGVEESWERAPHGIDLNVARITELMKLPGVGLTRAQAIIMHRDSHGRFQSIYDLAGVPGVGPALFRRMTGLSVRQRADRHAALGHFLTLPTDQAPLLSRVVEAIRAEFSGSGAVLTNVEGMPIAVAGVMPDANQYAALGSRFFFRARRHLQRFVARASDCIILPGSTPPLLLLSSEDVVVIVTLSGGAVSQKRLGRVRRAMREVGWVLSRRAVVLRA